MIKYTKIFIALSLASLLSGCSSNSRLKAPTAESIIPAQIAITWATLTKYNIDSAKLYHWGSFKDKSDAQCFINLVESEAIETRLVSLTENRHVAAYLDSTPVSRKNALQSALNASKLVKQCKGYYKQFDAIVLMDGEWRAFSGHRYNQSARQRGVEGECMVQFDVDSQGRVTTFHKIDCGSVTQTKMLGSGAIRDLSTKRFNTSKAAKNVQIRFTYELNSSSQTQQSQAQ